MADSTAATSPPAHAEAGRRQPGGHQEAVAALTESFIDLQRTVRRSKARLLAAAGDDVESAGHALLHTVQTEGPMRTSALAASVNSDLSTVSRQVTVLVGRGLLERRADQLDGRASLLAVTDAGRATIARHERGRQAFFDEVLTGWTIEEVRQFAQQMERFTASYDQIHTALMNRRTGPPETHTPTAEPHHPADLERP